MAYYIFIENNEINGAGQARILNEGIINFEVHFYPDKDVTDYEFNKTLYAVNSLPCNIFIHRNIQQDEKDYGVPIDRIKDSIKMIREIDYV